VGSLEGQYNRGSDHHSTIGGFVDISKVFRITDEATTGRWFPFGSDSELLIAKMGNERHQATLKRLMRPYRNLKVVPDDILRSVGMKAVSETILLGWKGFDDGETKNVPYTSETAYKWFNDYPDFYEAVLAFANNWQNYTDSEGEDTGKN
jgi:hypothetical protein